jgi:capsular polysaccharide biosynthesis protein
MELRRLWSLVWSRKPLIGIMLAAALLAGWGATPKTSRYQATAVLFVGISQFDPSNAFSNNQQAGLQLAASTFAAIATEFDVVQSALASTGIARTPDQVVHETKASPVPATTLIHISVTDKDPVVAQTLANGVSNAFVAEMKRIYPIDEDTLGHPIPATSPVSVTQSAQLPTKPVSNGLGRILTLSGVFGLLAGIALILLLDYLDLSVRTPEDLERKIGLPILGVIPLFPQLPERESLIVGSVVRRPDQSFERLGG